MTLTLHTDSDGTFLCDGETEGHLVGLAVLRYCAGLTSDGGLIQELVAAGVSSRLAVEIRNAIHDAGPQ